METNNPRRLSITLTYPRPGDDVLVKKIGRDLARLSQQHARMGDALPSDRRYEGSPNEVLIEVKHEFLREARADGRPELLPCPFCEGPPVPIVQRTLSPGGAAPLKDDYEDEDPELGGLMVKAFVFCHECGARGPYFDPVIETRADYYAAEAEGVRLWQERNARHRNLFDSSEERELNVYPRPDEDPAPTGGA
jgi:hypothetical protein